MFDEPCSIYARANDARGEYFDRETGEIIQQMTVGEFLFNEQWREPVERLRQMVAEYGAVKAKKRDDYKALKQSLPGATLSGLFSYRKTACLVQHTGYLVLDIDYGDNLSITNWKNILRTLRNRPEIAVAMRSCSGTGYFALARLAYPQYHKQQCAALMKEYAALGITLDRSCSDITRVRFASWDDQAFIREQPVPYTGIELEQMVLAPQAAVVQYRQDQPMDEQRLMRVVEKWVSEVERRHIDLTEKYAEWVNIGLSMKEFGEQGRAWFHRLSAMNKNYHPAETDKKWVALGDSTTITSNYFFARCKERGISFR